MNVQDVKRECTAIVGISAEFTNSEIRSICDLACKVGEAIEKAIDQQVALMKNSEGETRLLKSDEDDVPVVLNLSDVERVHWFLSLFDNTTTSSMFDEADKGFKSSIQRINDAVSSEKV